MPHKGLEENVNEMVPEDGKYFPTVYLSDEQLPELVKLDVEDEGEMNVTFVVVGKNFNPRTNKTAVTIELRTAEVV